MYAVIPVSIKPSRPSQVKCAEVKLYPTQRQAVDAANELLAKNCESIGMKADLEKAMHNAIHEGNIKQPGITFACQENMMAKCTWLQVFTVFIQQVDTDSEA